MPIAQTAKCCFKLPYEIIFYCLFGARLALRFFSISAWRQHNLRVDLPQQDCAHENTMGSPAWQNRHDSGCVETLFRHSPLRRAGNFQRRYPARNPKLSHEHKTVVRYWLSLFGRPRRKSISGTRVSLSGSACR